MSKKTFLVFAVITLVAGAILLTGWGFILATDIALRQQFPGTEMSPEGVISFYILLSVGIVLVVVSIVLFVIRAKKS